ncbi:MAG TPA: signal peptidase I [Candidatus Aenigmarchaeota archaeon]|nr:signal peptidase I [Candidatus Aenigmarchaeota archaeon]
MVGRRRKSQLKRIWKRLNEGWVGNIFYAVLGLLLAFFFYNVVLSYALNTPTPVVAVVSSSMQHDNPEVTHYKWLQEHFNYTREFIDSWPFPNGFSVGDMPVIKGSKDYKVGDIIVYRVPGQPAPIIHRIVKINEDGTFQTKGDNNPTQLPYEYRVERSQIYGKVIFIIPKLGYVKVALTRIIGFGW